MAFILFLSDYIAKKTGHERYEVFENRFRQEIFIPNNDELNNLKKSLTFKINDLKTFKDSLNINENIGDNFIIKVGDDKFNNFLLTEEELKEHDIIEDLINQTNSYSIYSTQNPLLKSPIIEINDTYIIFPTLLSISLRHNIISTIIKFNEKDNFITNYQNNLWSSILFNLKNKLYFEEFNYELPKWENTIFKDEVFRIDTDKLAYCILINDDLNNYNENEPLEEIDLNYESIIKNRINCVIDNLFEDENVNEILIILFTGLSGRPYYTKITETPKNTTLLMINCEEFNVIANSGNYDSLTLYKFAKLLENKNIIGNSFLDKFSFYIEQNHSFYIDD